MSSTANEASPRPGQQADDGYAAEVRTVWSEFLATLPGAAKVLDIGMGNHVPALIAAGMMSSGDRDWTIDAIDPAGKEEGTLARRNEDLLARVIFHGDATPGALPFEASRFDAVCGHHVLEFADPVPALSEVLRVLKPGGDAQFTLHHAESVLVGSARLSLREADLVFSHTKAFRRLHRLVTMSQITPGTTERATNELRHAIRALKRALPMAEQQGGGRVLKVALDAIQKLLAARREMKPDAAGLQVDRAEAEVRASVRRLNAMVERARTAADMQALEQHAADIGFTQIEWFAQTHAGADIVGWQLLLHRA